MATTHTSIAWTDRTWNPTRGCRRISPGCANCYAERQGYRFSGAGLPYEGLVRLGANGPQWTGRGRFVLDALDEPLSWRKPQRVFVDSMSDLFFDAFTNEEIAAVFGVMAACPHITFQVLTKRARRMREWFEWVTADDLPGEMVVATCASNYIDHPGEATRWPLPNVWLGVSVESQKYADERIPDLLAVPAAIRFVSYEPALGPIDFEALELGDGWKLNALARDRVTTGRVGTSRIVQPHPALDWVIVGGESGPGAREFDIRWAERIVRQCRDARVACFVKQLGSKPHDSNCSIVGGWCPGDPEPDTRVRLTSRKGDEPLEWPAALRVQQFPTSSVAA